MHLRDQDERLDFRAEAVEPFVEAARQVGVDEIGFTEHVYYFRQTRELWHVPYHTERCSHDLEAYVEAVIGAKERGLPVKLGLEVDYEPGREDETRALLEPYPWDYLLGSVHFVDGLGIDGEPRLLDELGVEETWARYFSTLARAAQSRLFDSLAHPDLVKMWGERPERELERTMQLQAAGAIAESGVAIEVSTAGLRRPVAELYPDPGLLAACRERGVPVTLASDAHLPELVGRDFDHALELLRSTGYETITVFEQRTSRQVRFDA